MNKSTFFVVVFFFLCPLLVLQKALANEVKLLSIDLDHDVSIPVNLKKYGANGALLWSDIGYDEKKLVEIYKQLGIIFTRFPGGTIGNFYNWEKGNFTCEKNPDEKTVNRIETLNSVLMKRSVNYKIDVFFNFINNAGVDFTFVFNTMCASQNKNAALLEYMKNNNISLRYVEMANETYSNDYSWAYKDAQSYLESAKTNYLLVKRYFPEANIGLVVSPVSFSGNLYPEEMGIPNKSWPAKLRGFDLGSAEAQFGDALIIHPYTHPYDVGLGIFEPISEKDHYLKVIEQFNSKFNISMDYLNALGKGKPIWITEWGVTAPIEKRNREPFKNYLKSAFQGLYAASVLTSISLEKKVEIANYHNATDLWNLEDQQTKLSPVGIILSLFTDAAKTSRNIFKVMIQPSRTDVKLGDLEKVKNFNLLGQRQSEFDGANDIWQVKGLKAMAFESDSQFVIFIINEQEDHYKINRFNIGSQNFSEYSTNVLRVVDNIFQQEIGASQNINDIEKIGIDVPPLSFLIIKMK